MENIELKAMFELETVFKETILEYTKKVKNKEILNDEELEKVLEETMVEIVKKITPNISAYLLRLIYYNKKGIEI